MLENVVKSNARPLPIILLLDTSGSMEGCRIKALNSAIKDMINSFTEEENIGAETQVAIITFGGEAKLHTDITPAKDIIWSDLTAKGMTSLGGALDIAKEMIEDKERIPSRAYKPTVIVVSDGMPNDNYHQSLENFMKDRSGKCDRWAMAIGDDANKELLKEFVNNEEQYFFEASDVSQIKKFFRVVTISEPQIPKTSNTEATHGKFKEMFDIIDEYEDNEYYF